MERENKGKQITITIFLIATLINIFSFFSFKESIRQEEIKKFKNELKHHTKHKVQDTKSIIDHMIDNLEETRDMIEIYTDFDKDTIKKILTVSNRLNHFNFTSFAYPDGNGFDNIDHKFNILDRDYFQKSIKGNTEISGVLSSKVENKKPVQIISIPVYNKEKIISGILFGVFDFQTIEKLTNTDLDGNGKNQTYILTEKGIYITKPKEFKNQTNFWDHLNNVKISKKEIAKIKRNFSNKRDGEFSYINNGITYYGYYAPISDINSYIISEIGDETINSYIKSINKLAIKDEIFTIICFGVMLLCVFFYFKKASKEIKEANKKIDKNMDIMYKAAEHSENLVFTYDNHSKEVYIKTRKLNLLFREPVILSVPNTLISYEIISPESIENLKNLFLENNGQKSKETDIKIIHEGKEIWYNIALYNSYNEKNILIDTIGVVRDITDIKNKEKEIKRKLEIYDKLVENSIFYAKVDLEKNILIELNGKENFTDFSIFIEKVILKRVKTEHLPFVLNKFSLKNLNDAFDKGKEFLETEFIIENQGSYKWVSCVIYRLSLNDKRKVLFVINDIDQKKHKELELKKRAEQDGLTGLYNAVTSKAKITESLLKDNLSSEKQIFILFDLDNYKLINDTFGHFYGDNVLIDVSNILKHKFRSNDIIGRLGGDEFVILLTNINSDFDVEKLAERLIENLRKSLEKVYKKGEKEVKVSSSIGYVIAPDDGITFETLYKKADKALYQVKKNGKNNFIRYQQEKNK